MSSFDRQVQNFKPFFKKILIRLSCVEKVALLEDLIGLHSSQNVFIIRRKSTDHKIIIIIIFYCLLLEVLN